MGMLTLSFKKMQRNEVPTNLLKFCGFFPSNIHNSLLFWPFTESQVRCNSFIESGLVWICTMWRSDFTHEISFCHTVGCFHQVGKEEVNQKTSQVSKVELGRVAMGVIIFLWAFRDTPCHPRSLGETIQGLKVLGYPHRIQVWGSWIL